MDLNFEIYKGKNFSGLCKDIVKNSENKKDQIDILISELRTLIKTVNDAVIIVPLIKDYYDVGRIKVGSLLILSGARRS